LWICFDAEKTDFVTDALQQRMAKYKEKETQAKRDGDIGKTKRLERIVKVKKLCE